MNLPVEIPASIVLGFKHFSMLPLLVSELQQMFKLSEITVEITPKDHTIFFTDQCDIWTSVEGKLYFLGTAYSCVIPSPIRGEKAVKLYHIRSRTFTAHFCLPRPVYLGQFVRKLKNLARLYCPIGYGRPTSVWAAVCCWDCLLTGAYRSVVQ